MANNSPNWFDANVFPQSSYMRMQEGFVDDDLRELDTLASISSVKINQERDRRAMAGLDYLASKGSANSTALAKYYAELDASAQSQMNDINYAITAHRAEATRQKAQLKALAMFVRQQEEGQLAKQVVGTGLEIAGAATGMLPLAIAGGAISGGAQGASNIADVMESAKTTQSLLAKPKTTDSGAGSYVGKPPSETGSDRRTKRRNSMLGYLDTGYTDLGPEAVMRRNFLLGPDEEARDATNYEYVGGF